MRHTLRLAVTFAFVAAMLSPGTPAAAEHDEERVIVQEWQSANPVDLSVETSQFSYPEELEEYDIYPDTVLIGRDDQFADALASASLQGVMLAPLLLTPTGELAGSVAQEISRLRPSRAVIIGGPGAISMEVQAQLEDLVSTVTRLAGRDRITTAAILAAEAERLRREEDYTTHSAIVVRAFGDGAAGYVDALSAGALSVMDSGMPILLSETDRLSEPSAEFLRAHEIQDVYVIGGRSAISDAAFAQIETIVDDADRISGEDRFTTALAVAREMYGDGGTIADALGTFLVDASSPLAWASGFTGALLSAGLSPVLLVNGDAIPPATAEWLGSEPIPEDDLFGVRFLFCSAGVRAATCHDAANMVDAAFQ